MATKERLIEEYKNHNSIMDKVRTLGGTITRNNKTKCLFHSPDKDPSMQLYPKTNTYKCFACGAFGDVIDYEKQATGKTLNDIIGYDGEINERKIENIVMEKYPLKEYQGEEYKFNRTHFYHNENGDIASIKIIYKNEDKTKKTATQYNIKNNKIEYGPVIHTCLYNLPGILAAKAQNRYIYIVEGEKDSLTLIGQGLSATTTKDGANSWKSEYNEVLNGCNIVVIGDNDDAGKKYVEKIKKEVMPISTSFKIIELPGLKEKQDLTDWFNLGHTKEELKELFCKSMDLKLQNDIFRYDFSDLGIVKRFKDQYKEIIKYAVDTKFYYSWNGKQWIRYDDELPISTIAIEFITDLVSKIKKYIKYLEDDDAEIYKKIISKLCNDRTINFITKRYKSFQDTHIKSSILDMDAKYINCNNGIVDTENGKLLPYNKDLYITKIADVDYLPGKVNELYKGAINRLFNSDPEEVEAFEILLGYMLSGKANLKSFPIIHGAKNSGKSKIFEVILNTLGEDYVKTINKSLLMKAWDNNQGAEPELAELPGIRLLICSETNDSDYLNTDFIKKLVGGDTMKARPLYKPPIQFRPIFVPVIFTNDKPNFDGNDDAIVFRLVLIELLYPIDPKKMNPNFEEQILEDKAGVFSYLIGLIVRFNKIGDIKRPIRWKNNQTEYMIENNPYLKFKTLYLSELMGHNVPATEIYPKFEYWYIDNYSKNIPSRKKITQGLKKLGIETGMTHGVITYKNLVLNVKESVNSELFRLVK